MYYPLTAKWTILPGNEKEAVTALKQLALDVREKEPDTLLYMVHVPNFNETSLPTPAAGEVDFWEVYTDKKAFERHLGGDVFQNFVKDHGHLFLHDFATPPNIFMITESLTRVGGFARPEING